MKRFSQEMVHTLNNDLRGKLNRIYHLERGGLHGDGTCSHILVRIPLTNLNEDLTRIKALLDNLMSLRFRLRYSFRLSGYDMIVKVFHS